MISRVETRRVTNGTLHIDDASADPADQVVVIVADAVFEQSRGTSRLNAPDEPFVHQHTERIVNRLQGNRADLVADDFSHAVSCDVRLAGNRFQHRNALRGDVNATFAKQADGIWRHGRRSYQSFE